MKTLSSYLLATSLLVSLPSLSSANYQPITPPAEPSANEFSLGVEGFHDRYREPEIDVTETTDYGSITGGWKHYWPMLNDDKFLVGADVRFSTGTDSYKSSSGTLSGSRQNELEGRLLTGFQYGHFLGGTLSPYIGFGVRYFVDNGKGEVTNLGAHAYDRRITQEYIPIGLTYNYIGEGGWSITPTIEYDPLVYGNVNTRLQNITGFYNINNTQNAGSGYGLRGSIMFGFDVHGYDIQAGPFVRYWNINDSELTVDPAGTGWIEPKNTRTQVGAEVKVKW